MTAERLVSAIPLPRHRPPRPPKPPRPAKPPRIVETLHKAMEWRKQLDAGDIANQVEIARREGLTRARVTQVLNLLRLAPETQKRILNFPETTEQPTVSEHHLRPMADLLRDAQLERFTDLTS